MSRLDFARIVRNLRLKTSEYNQTGSALALAEMRNCEAQVDAALAEEFAPPTTGLVRRPPQPYRRMFDQPGFDALHEPLPQEKQPPSTGGSTP